MKIGQLENIPNPAAAGERKPGAATGAVSGKSTLASAQVDLSSTAAQLAAAGSDSVFDTAKVQRISEAIREGKFQINPHVIADKLIANAQELMGTADRR